MSKFKHGAATVLATAVVALTGCTTTGVGGGDITQKGKAPEPVMFTWKSTDGGITGTMTATLPTATYQGPFLQVTQQTQSEAFAPMWAGYPPGWSDWSYWGWGGGMGGMGMGGMYDSVQFATVYSGKVIANLKSLSGTSQIRCRLHMLHPSQGMSGGGTGECQLSGGATFQANF
ncbi:MAG TPA: hypothetical protein VGI11_10455 [Variovorax sp.]|jgi:hypothetical protein